PASSARWRKPRRKIARNRRKPPDLHTTVTRRVPLRGMLERAPLSASAARALPGFICAYRFDRDGSPFTLAEWEIAADLALPEGEWLWLHFNLTDRRCLKWMERSGRVPALAIDFL